MIIMPALGLSTSYGADLLKPTDIARTHILRGESDKALSVIKSFLINNPGSSTGYYLESVIYRRQEQFDMASESLAKARNLEPDSPRLLLAQANLYYESGKMEGALAAYLELKGESKYNLAYIYRQIARIYLKMHRYEDAIKAAKTAAAVEPYEFQNYRLLGLTLHEAGDYNESARNYKKELDLLTGRTSLSFLDYSSVDLEYTEPPTDKTEEIKTALYLLAEVYSEAGNTDEAIKYYNVILNLYQDEFKPYINLSRLYREKGMILQSIWAWLNYTLSGSSFTGFLTFLMTIIVLFYFVMYFFRLANSVFLLPFILISGALGRTDWLDKLSKLSAIYATGFLIYLCNYEITLIDPKKGIAWSNLGIYFERKNKLGQALACYQRALYLDREIPAKWFSLGVVLYHLKEYKKAEIAFKEALRLNCNNHFFWYYLGLSFYDREMYPEAIKASHQALKLAPDFSPGLDLFIDSCESSGEIEFCKEVLLGIIAKNSPAVNIKYYVEMGSVLLCSGESFESIRYFQKAADLLPDSYEAWYNLGLAQREMGWLDRASDSIKRAIDLYPGASWIYTSFGLTHYKNRKTDEAKKTIKRALELDPLSSYSHYLMGLILRELEPRQAKKHMTKALKYFTGGIDALNKPWQKANEFECIAIAYQVAGEREKAVEAFREAVKYARISPPRMWIFSEEQMKLTNPEEFIKECNRKISDILSEASVELSTE